MSYVNGNIYDWFERFHQQAYDLAAFASFISEGDSYYSTLDINTQERWTKEARMRKYCLTTDGSYLNQEIFNLTLASPSAITTEGDTTTVFTTEDGTVIASP